MIISQHMVMLASFAAILLPKNRKSLSKPEIGNSSESDKQVAI